MNMTKVMSQDQLVLAGQRLRVACPPHLEPSIESDKHLLHFTRWRVDAEGPEGPWFLGYDGDSDGDARDARTSKRLSSLGALDVASRSKARPRTQAWKNPESTLISRWLRSSRQGDRRGRESVSHSGLPTP